MTKTWVFLSFARFKTGFLQPASWFVRYDTYSSLEVAISHSGPSTLRTFSKCLPHAVGFQLAFALAIVVKDQGCWAFGSATCEGHRFPHL